MSTVVVVGLGYVGLPLALALSRVVKTKGYDISESKIKNIQEAHSDTPLELSNNPEIFKSADFIIVALPTPVDKARQPNLDILKEASITIAKYLKPNTTIIYESTVYPGVTEEVCVPILEQYSGFTWKKDFFVGYSPERINPGDKVHTLETIVKVVSGDTPETLKKISELYQKIITAGVHEAPSIQVAEAAKVIENTQRDLNIALMNELSIIFNRLNINTIDVLKAAETKWNFLPFRPGLVGGHCIGVDPYYLTHKAQIEGYQPAMILAGRRLNDGMGAYVATQTVKRLMQRKETLSNVCVNICGITFKENCPDWRNSKVIDIIRELESYHIEVRVHDPYADPVEVKQNYGLDLIEYQDLPEADAMILAVSHDSYQTQSFSKWTQKLKPQGLFVDVKSVVSEYAFVEAGYHYWSL